LGIWEESRCWKKLYPSLAPLPASQQRHLLFGCFPRSPKKQYKPAWSSALRHPIRSASSDFSYSPIRHWEWARGSNGLVPVPSMAASPPSFETSGPQDNVVVENAASCMLAIPS
jgi:hypothetical protein